MSEVKRFEFHGGGVRAEHPEGRYVLYGDMAQLKQAYDFVAEKEAEVRDKLSRYIKAFRHTHVSGTTKGLDIDTCAQCGMDLREAVHFPDPEAPRG